MDHETVVGAHGAVDDVEQRRAHPAELAQGGPDLVDELGTMGGQPSAAGPRVAPPVRDHGVALGQNGHVHEPGGDARLPQEPGGHRPRQERLPGVVTELGAHDMNHPGPLGRGQYPPPLGGVSGEGFLAQNVLAGGDGLEGEIGVGEWRGGDRHGRHARYPESLAQGAAGAGDVEQTGSLRRPGRVTSHHGHDVETGGPQCPDMGEAPEPGPDDHDTEATVTAGVTRSRHGATPSTTSRSRRVASAASRAAASQPSAWSSSEKTSTPIGARESAARKAPR